MIRLTSAVVCVCTTLLIASAFAAAPARLNVLVITVDDLRDTLGCYGNTAVGTVTRRQYC